MLILYYVFCYVLYEGNTVHSSESESDSRVAPVSTVESQLDLLYLIRQCAKVSV